MNIEDIAIIGGGPAGVSAAIYLKRYGYEPVMFEKGLLGGKLNYITEIDNFAGFLGTGQELAANLTRQIADYQIKVINSNVISIQKDGDEFRLEAESGSYRFKAIIVTAGLREKAYEVPGSRAFEQRGISRCALCDGPLYRKKDVAVLGSGNAAVEETIYLASICNRVYLINPEEEFHADARLLGEVENLENVEIKKGYDLVGSRGERALDELALEHRSSKAQERIAVRALFIYIGSTPTTAFLPFPEIISPAGFIKTDELMNTLIPGLFAAGDVRTTKLRQVSTAVSDGAIAATSVRDYLKKLKKNGNL